MIRTVAPIALLAVLPAFGGTVQFFSVLPSGAVSRAIRVDAAGNIYMAGSVTRQGLTDAFVAKVSPDGSKLSYFTVMAGSFADDATTLALGSDGAAYVAGDTASPDFPVTDGALQRTYFGGGQRQGFLAKVNAAGAIVYSSFINGTASTMVSGIAIDSAGEVFLTRTGGPGYPGDKRRINARVCAEAGCSDEQSAAVDLWAGRRTDRAGQQGEHLPGGQRAGKRHDQPRSGTYSATISAGRVSTNARGAFLPKVGFGSGWSRGSVFMPLPICRETQRHGQPAWGTHVTGTYGATARGMAVHSTGNVIVAGTTNSDDYPVTPGAFQTAYSAGAPPFPVVPGSSYRDPPPATRYITKINATGTGLIWSSYFGGSYADQITGMAVDPKGDIYVSGSAGSSGLPALEGTPKGCRPAAVQELGFVVRLADDGATTGPVQLMTGAPDCSFFSCSILSDYTNS